jgi:threonyl-tRNA synthetase
MILRNELEKYWRAVHARYGYEEIKTPQILNAELWHRSGHWDHYQENMYFTTIDEADFAIKPMNCPGGMLAYKRRPWSYKDLPLRIAELGLVHRHELSGALHGLMRVRCFTQDDAHIFMTPEQVKSEIGSVIDLIGEVYETFGFKYRVELSTCPEKFIGSDEIRRSSENTLKEVLAERGMDFVLNPGDGAFYGPKIDFHLEDSLGRTWQCGTIQLDYQMPERFELEYTAADGSKRRPVMVHRVAFGSIERFIGILTEHFAGAFPLWLAPVQAIVLPITDRARSLAESLSETLKNAGIRAETDQRNEKIGYKIREAQLQKIPYMLVLGDKEAESGAVSVRTRSGGDMGVMTTDDFLAKIIGENSSKAY